MSFKSNPELAADIEAISALLREVSIGATVKYSELTKAIGADIRNRRYVIYAARRAVERDTGALFEIVRDVGIKRLSSSEATTVGQSAIRKIRRAARTGMNRLSALSIGNMLPDEARQVIAQRSQLGAIAVVADNRKSASIVGEIKDSAVVPAGRVLEMFR